MLSEPARDIFADLHPHQTVDTPSGSPTNPQSAYLASRLAKAKEAETSSSSLGEEDDKRQNGGGSTPHATEGDARVRLYDEERLHSAVVPHARGSAEGKVCNDEFDWWGLSSRTEWLKIGKGGYGTVYKAKWYGTTVAIKEAFLGRANAKRSLRKEVQYLTSLNHPNVVRIYGCFESKDSFYVVMEYLPHCLRDEWVAGRVDMLQVMTQVARAMLFLHCKGIVHRDFKSRNICLSSDYKVAKVIDYGLAASMFSSPEELMKKVGTRKYRAPEVNHPNVQGFGVDVYSCSAMLKRLLDDMECNIIKCTNSASLATVLAPLASMCMHQNPCVRPTALEILQYLHQCTHSVMPVKEIFATPMNEDLKDKCLGLDSTYEPLRKLPIELSSEDVGIDIEVTQNGGRGKKPQPLS